MTAGVVSEGVCHEASLLSSRFGPMSEPDDDDEDLEPDTFILMSAEEAFDGQERVMSRAAYDLQCRATAHSASCSHPGYVPDDYLEHLDGLGIETTITAAELCAIGTWERIDGGYRILDWEAVEYALDGIRQRRGEDPQALAAEREHEVKIHAHMAKSMVVTPPCAACGTPHSPHRACPRVGQIISVITGQIADQLAAVAVALAVVSDAGIPLPG